MVSFKIVRVPEKDHQSFSFETKLSDEVLRYGKNFKYSHEDVKEIVEYARVRGIRARLKHSQFYHRHMVTHDGVTILLSPPFSLQLIEHYLMIIYNLAESHS